MFRVFITLVFMQFSACSVLPSGTEKTINLQFNEPNRISFQGKGAGAGIALMGTMGPVGIAIGVAIDEGIAKDIRKSVASEQGDSKVFATNMVASQLKEQGYSVTLNAEQPTYPSITIKRYGFKIVNGSTDATAAQWDIEIETEPGKKTNVHYPKDFNKESIKTYMLEDLKMNGNLGVELLSESLGRVVSSNKLNFGDIK